MHDINERIEELKNFPNGWLDGEGLVYDPLKLDIFKKLFYKYYDHDCPCPLIFPMLPNDLSIEWNLPGNKSISIELNMGTFMGWYMFMNDVLNTDDVEFKELTINLGEEAGWDILNKEIKKIMDGDA